MLVPPKEPAKLVTRAVSGPGLGGCWKTRVSFEELAAAMVKSPLVSSTLFPEGFGSKPAPEMLSVSGGVGGAVAASVAAGFAWTLTLPVPSRGMIPGQTSGSAQALASQRWVSSVKESPLSQRVQPPVYFCC